MNQSATSKNSVTSMPTTGEARREASMDQAEVLREMGLNPPDSYWRQQFKAAEKAKMLAIGYADQAEERLRKAMEANAGELAEARSALGWVRKLHQPSDAAICRECGRDWPCATIRAVGDSV